jgi:hypothetical protein
MEELEVVAPSRVGGERISVVKLMTPILMLVVLA